VSGGSASHHILVARIWDLTGRRRMASTMNNCMSPVSLMLPTVLTIGPLSTRSTPCHLLVCPCGSPYHHAGHGVRKGGAPDDDAARGAHLSREAWKQGFLKDVVAQIPLSVLNFAVAVCKLTRDVPIEGGVNDVSVGDHGRLLVWHPYEPGRLLVRHHVMLSRRRWASTSSMSTTVVHGGARGDQASVGVEVGARELIL
jgi:hypothetical protein